MQLKVYNQQILINDFFFNLKNVSSFSKLTMLVYRVHIPAVKTILRAMLNGVTALSAREVR